MLGESRLLAGGRLAMEPRGMEYFSAQVQQTDVGGRLQAGQELLLHLGTPGAVPDLEEDLGRLGRTVDAVTGWVGSSNYRVSGRRGRASRPPRAALSSRTAPGATCGKTWTQGPPRTLLASPPLRTTAGPPSCPDQLLRGDSVTRRGVTWRWDTMFNRLFCKISDDLHT